MTFQHFSEGELDDMAEVQVAHMMDTCLIAVPTSIDNVYNLNVETFDWIGADESACGFNPNPSKELLNQVPDSQCVLRLPIGTEITYRANVRITKLAGRAITPVTFRVIGQPRQGPSGLLVWLTKVTDGSDG